MRHARHVCINGFELTRPDKAKGIHPLEGDGSSLYILRAEGRNVVLQGHRHAAHQVVHDRHGVHAEGKIVIHRRAMKKALDGSDDVLAAVLFPAAEDVGIFQLERSIAADQTVYGKPGHIRHGVTVQLEGADGFAVVVKGKKQQEVRQVVVIEQVFHIADRASAFHGVLADQKDALQTALHGINLAVILDEAGIVFVNVILGVRNLGLFRLGKKNRRCQQDQQDQIHNEEDDFAAFGFKHIASFFP